MPRREFENGYIAGWTWIKGNEPIPAIPPCKSGELMPYQTGVFEGARDACLSEPAQNPLSDSDSAQYWVDQFLNRKPISWGSTERRHQQSGPKRAGTG
jgi:hypothetical protein